MVVISRPSARRNLPVVVLSTVLALAAAVATYALLTGGGDDPPVMRLDPQAAGGPAPSGDRAEEVATGDVAALTYQDLEGRTVAVADLLDRPMVINLWGSWCVPCITEMPEIERVHQDLGDEVVFVGLAVQDRPEAAIRTVEQTGVTYAVGRDVDDRAYQALGAVQMPTTAFVTAEGEVARVRLGAVDEAELRSLIAEHLGVGG